MKILVLGDVMGSSGREVLTKSFIDFKRKQY